MRTKHIRTFRSKKLHPEHAKLINEAIRHNAKGGDRNLQISYKKENGEVSERKVKPLAVKGKSLFVAHCHERNAIRSFRVERINMVKQAFWNGFEKRAKVTIDDVEGHLETSIHPQDVKTLQQDMDRLNSSSLALKHPILTGIPTLGIWPAYAQGKALRELGGKLKRNNPYYKKTLDAEATVHHERQKELIPLLVAQREAEARENMMRHGVHGAITGLGMGLKTYSDSKKPSEQKEESED